MSSFPFSLKLFKWMTRHGTKPKLVVYQHLYTADLCVPEGLIVINVLRYVYYDDDVHFTYLSRGESSQSHLSMKWVDIPNLTNKIVFRGRKAIKAYTPEGSDQRLSTQVLLWFAHPCRGILQHEAISAEESRSNAEDMVRGGERRGSGSRQRMGHAQLNRLGTMYASISFIDQKSAVEIGEARKFSSELCRTRDQNLDQDLSL